MAATASGKHGRAAWATGLSLVLHVLALTGMVVGIKVVSPPPEDQAIELQLVRPFERPPPPEPSPQPSRPSKPAPSVRARPTPPPSPQPPLPALQPEAPAPAPSPKPQVAGPPDTSKPGFSGRMGCDDPLGIHLNEQQLQSCANDRARLAREAKPLDLNIPDRKKADYDRASRCQDARREREVPSLGSSGPPKPGGSNINPSYGASVGMGRPYGYCWAN